MWTAVLSLHEFWDLNPGLNCCAASLYSLDHVCHHMLVHLGQQRPPAPAMLTPESVTSNRNTVSHLSCHHDHDQEDVETGTYMQVHPLSVKTCEEAAL